ncbi:MAG: hypothetical protein R2710_05020 [Acidimicrobiales bacterium]
MPVERAIQTIGHADIAFCDPPYRLDIWETLLAGIDADLIVGHAERPIALTDRWVEERRRSYGRAKIVIAPLAAGSIEVTGSLEVGRRSR